MIVIPCVRTRLAPAWIAALTAAAALAGRAAATERGAAPTLTIAVPPASTTVLTAKEVPPPPPAPVPDPPEPQERRVIVGAAAASFVSPILSAARAGPTSFTWLGLSAISANGRGWFLPPPRRGGFVASITGRYVMAEAMPVAIYYVDAGGGVGWRYSFKRRHHLAWLAGAQGSGGLGMQTEFKVIRIPEASVAYQWHSNKVFFEVGPLGGWSLAGRFSVGSKIVGRDKNDSDFYANTHYFRPYIGGQASLVVMPLMLTVVARQTFLGADDTGSALTQGHAQTCLRMSKSKSWLVMGGCLTVDMVRGDVVRVAPQSGPGGEGWAYRLALDLMFAWAQNR